MARIRSIKPEFPHSESMGSVSRESRLLFILLWTVADDAGRLRGNSRMLASLLFPYDDDAKDLIEGWLTELETEGCVQRYQVGRDSYLEICNWLNHQKIDKPTPSKLPAFVEPSASPREDSRSLTVGREGIGEDGKGSGVDQELPSKSASLRVSDLVALEIPEQLAKDFLSNRKAKKSPLTQTALDGIAREAGNAGITLAVAIRTCTERGWAGFKAEWLTNQRGSKPDIEAQNQAELEAFLGGSRIIDGECSHA